MFVISLIKTGRRVVITVIVFVLSIEIFKGLVIDDFNFNPITILIAFFLVFFLYKGHDWAEGLIIALTGIAGVLALMWFIHTFYFRWLLYAFVNLAIAVILSKSESVAEFMKHQKKQ